MFHKLASLACSTGWFLNGVSYYKENNKDTWKGVQQMCTASGGDSLHGGYRSEENEHRCKYRVYDPLSLKAV